ncbi:hypothetical protein TR51_17720 [Kitasatospora griseola]|uniref:Uncharacterized protein n=1 Tax=Kitasatospora griseola TaxID=2064 RepID=A0A0D0NBM2_KITGR|nr:hypothetical protein [Kitasatospora griseola]KIQ65645.1 hypothetical protein TR51_17720 [Kitasatospora griseola]
MTAPDSGHPPHEGEHSDGRHHGEDHPDRVTFHAGREGVSWEAPDTPANRRVLLLSLSIVGTVATITVLAMNAAGIITALPIGSKSGDAVSTQSPPARPSPAPAPSPTPSPAPSPVPSPVPSQVPSPSAEPSPGVRAPRTVSFQIDVVGSGYELIDLDAPNDKPLSALVGDDDWNAMSEADQKSYEIVVHDHPAPTVVLGNLAAVLPAGVDLTEATCREAARAGTIKSFRYYTAAERPTNDAKGIRVGATLCLTSSKGAAIAVTITAMPYDIGLVKVDVTIW